jgi:alpha-D-xyloside xylohydrolase
MNMTRAEWRRVAVAALLAGIPALAGAARLATLDRNGSLVAVEPYGPNIVRVTIATEADQIDAPASDGISGKPDPAGWRRSTDAGADTFASAALSVDVAAQPWPKAPSQMERYFVPSLPPVSLAIRAADGRVLARMTGWDKAPQYAAGLIKVVGR